MSFIEELYVELFPAEASQRLLAQNKRFVHYTSAEVAMSILQNKQVWMRNTRTMNDFSEIEHGVNCLTQGLRHEGGKALHEAISKNFNTSGLMPFILKNNLEWFKNNTYITCISEHEDDEDGIGRLSMWRAYGGTTGVALVVKNTPFIQPADGLGAFTFPVTYSNGTDFGSRYQQMTDNILNNLDKYKNMGEPFVESLYVLMKYNILCTKHPGFREEKEWRVVYTPGADESPHIPKAIRSVRGTPQRVYMLPLENIDAVNFRANIPEFIDHIIIGPTSHPQVMREAFIQLLDDVNVPDPNSKVIVSDVPLRHYI